MKLKRIKEELERLKKCEAAGILPESGKEIIKEYEQVLAINSGRGVVDMVGVSVDGVEYNRNDISKIFYDYPKRDKFALKRELDSNPLTFIKLMGFKPVKGKENTYIKIK